ncbi:MAG: class I SAM-dependent methyltransferase [Burkholderiales bacterium]|jgi:S-adenosylmethionine-diacylgycerolhomoserine-N-methlytransferase
MSLLADARTLLQLARGSAARGSHAERLQAFYSPQAEHYDAFRERLLHGREELIRRLALPAGATVVELGGGTGRNLEYFGARLSSFARIEVVDLCPALLQQARRRCARWPGVAVTVEADATSYRPAQPVDCVYFSYALTMIPDWRAAVDNALAMLRPGGLLGAVDFYAAPHHAGRARGFWRRWFRHDGVHLDPGHLPYLLEHTEPVCCEERRAGVPYLPGLRVPYYLFIGRKPAR